MSKDLPNRQSIRLRDYNYASDGWYYVTICAQRRKEMLGKIKEEEMVLNERGQMVDKWWQKLPQRFNTIDLDRYVIMPNHLHGIIVIGNDDCRGDPCGRPLVRAGTRPAPTLGDVIGAFKSITTNQYMRNVKNNNWPPFNKRFWQRNYYDHIIRNDKELFEIRKYVKENPAKWEFDRNNPKNID